MQLQLFTVVSKLLVSLDYVTGNICGCYDMAADRMSSEQTSVELHLPKLIVVIWIKSKYQLSLKCLPYKTRLIRYVFTLYQLFP
jgi:hypothetical protein